ncbi:aspartate aminotransferase family protein [Cetobacterium sp. 2A]|uniref:(R)-1-hydroxy-2-aminoethylphosphonate ammonia-lyase n=1 Tax=Cetobacterium sp. 2A TaxID=2754723 RepID=UPI00163C32F6|nr:aspartate aminotransferase family protein [Cetobacterium sp. 2A]MBC2854954.1 aspartate aminotransferase family protein [Cetobacterium sp. 2A]
MKLDESLRVEGDTNLSSFRETWQNKNLSKESLRILEEDAKYFLHQSLSTPCLNVLKGSKGIYIEDLDGKLYLDFHGNNVHQVGYGNCDVIKAIKEEMDSLPFSPRRYTNEKAVALAKKLTELAPKKLNKILLTPGATSAIGMAMKLAKLATGKHNFISFWDSFHGASMDALSVGGEEFFRKGLGPMIPGCEHIIPYNSYRPLFGNSEDFDLRICEILEYTIEKQGEVAAVIMETFRNTDIMVPPKRFLKRIREICDKHNVLLILDETPIALGRTGKFFAFENFDIEPDMVVIGKGLGGGIFPIAALIARDDLDIGQKTALGHYTHEKSSVGSAAALATIEYIEKNRIMDNVNDLSKKIEIKLDSMKKKYSIIGDYRIIGLQFGIELVKDRTTKEKALMEAEKIMYKCLDRGLSFKISSGSVLTLAPALTIKEKDLDIAMNILESAIREVQEEKDGE